MKKIFLFLALCCFIPSVSSAQNWFINPEDGVFLVPFRADTAANQNNGAGVSDSSFFKFVPAFNCYYRGMIIMAKAGGVSTFRFVRRSLSLGTAIDSCVTATQAVGTNTINDGVLTSSTVPAKTILTPGVEYRVEIIYTSGAVFDHLSGYLVLSMR